ncbi:MAG: DUF6518 family protein [Nocardioidaceae bacterium]
MTSPASSKRPAKALSAALVLVAACAMGVFSDRGALLAEPWSALAEIGTPFVLVAFAAGRQPSRMGLSMLWGAAVLSIGLAAYYAWLFLVHDVAWGTLAHQYRAGAWLTAGVLVGALAGALGSASRRERGGSIRAVGWGLLIAVPLAEAVRASRWQPPQLGAGVVLLVLTASLYAWAVRQDRARWQLAAVAVVAVVPAVLVAENFRHLV